MRHRKKESNTFDVDDPNAVKYMCNKKGPEQYDVRNIDHFKDNETITVQTPYNSMDPIYEKTVTIAAKSTTTPEKIQSNEKEHYNIDFIQPI